MLTGYFLLTGIFHLLADDKFSLIPLSSNNLNQRLLIGAYLLIVSSGLLIIIFTLAIFLFYNEILNKLSKE